MTGVRVLSNEVLVATTGVVRVTAADAAEVVRRGTSSERKRARLCAHPAATDPLHEMLICLARGTYIRPHRHSGKSESFHVIEGELDVVLFDDGGTVRDVIRMGPYPSGRTFFYRLAEPTYHTVLVTTPHVLFHETTSGPFDPAGSEFAPWSPAEGEPAADEYLAALRTTIGHPAGAVA
ncbi:WbuC family cupin fold metalloprotein [Gemmata sp.]|uniref:WbuC family cupin fold metalloprotein n=1 Tax=Gemmata sp. TaxID=1914242 RepID=UPI003F6FFE08